jgi:hypothetical protein
MFSIPFNSCLSDYSPILLSTYSKCILNISFDFDEITPKFDFVILRIVMLHTEFSFLLPNQNLYSYLTVPNCIPRKIFTILRSDAIHLNSCSTNIKSIILLAIIKPLILTENDQNPKISSSYFSEFWFIVIL